MQIALSDLYGKKLALLLWFVNEEMETTTVLMSGVAFMREGRLALHRGSLVPPVNIPLALVWRAQPVPEDVRDIVNEAEYVIQASMSEIPLPKAG